MKKILLLISLFLSVLVSNAKGVEISMQSGSFDVLLSEQYVEVSLDCSQAIYKDEFPFDVFLQEENRDNDWKLQSILCFVKDFNWHTRKLEFRCVDPRSLNKGKYVWNICPKTISKKGIITADIFLKDKSTGEIKASVYFAGQNGDIDDSEVLNDQLSEMGEYFGKYVYNILKNK